MGNAEAEAQAFHHRARILEMLGRPADAVEDIARAVDLIEMLRGLSVPEPSARVAVFEDRQGVYADGVRLLFGLGRLEEALVMAERAKGRAILDILESRASGSPALLAAPAATFATMKTAAREGRSTFVSYVFAGPLLLVFAIDQQGAVHAAESPIAPEEVRRLVEAARASIAAGDAAADPLERLHAALIAPVEPWLPRDPEDVVTIVPHGPLFYLSFAALRDARARPLVESHALCYEPAIGLATLTRREQRADQRTVLAIGNPLMPAIPGRDLPPLPAAEDEARDVAARFPRSQDSLLLGNRASERQVRRLATGRACLHFATHAVLRDDEPLESLVILSATTGESDATADGLLTAEEILDLHLDADLVTLSACETGLGRVTGDGIIGLARSFLGAGAASVVASLWSVADVSTRFQMERFYSELGQGVPKARALRHAQVATIDALRQGAIRTPSGRVLPESPFFWAPFVLIGDPGR
ncbi:MAG: CHAT domain-containing protein [Acidobacteriota bacterium]